MPQSGSRNRQPMILATGAYLTSCIVQLRAPTSSSSLVIFTVRNEVAKVMFLHMSVILFTRYSPRSRQPPGAGIPREQRRLLLWTVRILLECILVVYAYWSFTVNNSIIQSMKHDRKVFGQISALFLAAELLLCYLTGNIGGGTEVS